MRGVGWGVPPEELQVIVKNPLATPHLLDTVLDGHLFLAYDTHSFILFLHSIIKCTSATGSLVVFT